ncbi:hypothetical protein V6Z11_D04G115600 [Gossypium hirsutum]|nr:hypothetical protein ES332_D04G111600v1 [Gossypium tomentosum]
MVFYNGRAPNGIRTEWKMNEYKAIEQGASSISATPTLRHEFSLCRVYKKSKCLRSFDRRPPAGGVQIIKPNAAAHQGEATAGEAASGYHKSHQMAGSPESSSSEDHGNPSQTGASNDSSATVFNYDELFWNLDGFWESQIP